METLDARARLAAEEKEMGALVYRFLTEMLYNRENIPRAEAATVAEVRALFSAAPQGALLAAADVEQALFLLDLLMAEPPLRFDLALGQYPQDARAFNAVCLLPAGAPPRNYPPPHLGGRGGGRAPLRLACRAAGRGRPARGLSRAARPAAPAGGVRGACRGSAAF